ncbi:unnamed protein product [Rotaria sp. Silwood2]|nr:unnamed protein product [Rotaria sp. Silwood2]CAF2955508.1 unnamed protein product [Rotaria sp. Silwood2]CAF3101308.1 unnamed protein product [Rotaria sp. Silwood2]CAF3943265.1 unnamed protein product [Rotaria sp. Silwood2]
MVFGGIRDTLIKPVLRPFTPILKPILRPACAVLNYGGINSAKDRRGAAQGEVNAAREQLAIRRQELERQRSEYNSFQDQKSLAAAQLHTLSTNLAQLQTRQAALANMIKDIRKVVMHLASFVKKSSVLYDELKDLVSFEALVKPLNAILTDLIDNGVTAHTIAGTTQISLAEIKTISDTLDFIKARLPFLDEDYSSVC